MWLGGVGSEPEIPEGMEYVPLVLVSVCVPPGVVTGVARRDGPWCCSARCLGVGPRFPDDLLDGPVYPFQVSVIGDGDVFGSDRVGRVVLGG